MSLTKVYTYLLLIYYLYCLSLVDPGNADFTERAEGNYPIIDKTGYIAKLLTKHGVVMIGPRRFGKTFIVSTIYAIFRNGPYWWSVHGSKFEIYHQYKYEFALHPVLRFDFSRAQNLAVLLRITVRELKDLYECYMYSNLRDKEENRIIADKIIQDLDFLGESIKENTNITNSTIEDLLDLVLLVITKTSAKAELGVILLIDEYDSPVNSRIQKIIEENDMEETKTETIINNMASLLEKPIDRFNNDSEIIKLKLFYSVLFRNLKTLRQKGSGNQIIPLKFTYITGIIPMSNIDLFSSGNDVTSLRLSTIYDLFLGLSECELQGDPVYLSTLR